VLTDVGNRQREVLAAALFTAVVGLCGCNCGESSSSPVDMDIGLDQAIPVDVRFDLPPNKPSPYRFDFGAVGDIDPSKCRTIDARVVSDTSPAFDAGAPRILWRKTLGTSSNISGIAGDDQSIVVNVIGKELFALNRAGGAVRWRGTIFNGTEPSDIYSLHLSGGSVGYVHGLFGVSEGYVERRDLQTGKLQWRQVVNATVAGVKTPLNSALGYFADGSMVFGVQVFTMRRLDASGAQQWSKSFHGSTSRGYVTSDGRLVVGLFGEKTKSRVAMIDGQGKVVWERVIPEPFAGVIPGPRGTVLVSAGTLPQHVMYALDESCGRQLWRYAYSATANWGLRVLPSGDALTVVAESGWPALMRVSSGGELVYRVELGRKYSFAGRTGPIGVDGTLYLAACPLSPKEDREPTLFGFDVETGKERFKLPLGKQTSCPGLAVPLLYPDGVLYLGIRSPTVEVIAIQTPSFGLAPSIWPTKGGGNRRLFATWPSFSER
jgi:outer membrane protein assembly factor BamB